MWMFSVIPLAAVVLVWIWESFAESGRPFLCTSCGTPHTWKPDPVIEPTAAPGKSDETYSSATSWLIVIFAVGVAAVLTYVMFEMVMTTGTR